MSAPFALEDMNPQDAQDVRAMSLALAVLVEAGRAASQNKATLGVRDVMRQAEFYADFILTGNVPLR